MNPGTIATQEERGNLRTQKKRAKRNVHSVGFEPTQTEAYHGLNVTP